MQTKDILQSLSIYNKDKENETTWQKINNGLSTLSTTIKSPSEVDTLFKHITPLLHTALLSERSILSGTALNLLDRCIEIKREGCFEFIGTLFKLINKPSKLKFKWTEPVLLKLIDFIALDTKLMDLLTSYYKSNNKMVRLVAIKCLKKKRCAESNKVIELAKCDASIEVRMEAKECYSPLKKIQKLNEPIKKEVVNVNKIDNNKINIAKSCYNLKSNLVNNLYKPVLKTDKKDVVVEKRKEAINIFDVLIEDDMEMKKSEDFAIRVEEIKGVNVNKKEAVENEAIQSSPNTSTIVSNAMKLSNYNINKEILIQKEMSVIEEDLVKMSIHEDTNVSKIIEETLVLKGVKESTYLDFNILMNTDEIKEEKTAYKTIFDEIKNKKAVKFIEANKIELSGMVKEENNEHIKDGEEKLEIVNEEIIDQNNDVCVSIDNLEMDDKIVGINLINDKEDVKVNDAGINAEQTIVRNKEEFVDINIKGFNANIDIQTYKIEEDGSTTENKNGLDESINDKNGSFVEYDVSKMVENNNKPLKIEESIHDEIKNKNSEKSIIVSLCDGEIKRENIAKLTEEDKNENNVIALKDDEILTKNAILNDVVVVNEHINHSFVKEEDERKSNEVIEHVGCSDKNNINKQDNLCYDMEKGDSFIIDIDIEKNDDLVFTEEFRNEKETSIDDKKNENNKKEMYVEVMEDVKQESNCFNEIQMENSFDIKTDSLSENKNDNNLNVEDVIVMNYNSLKKEMNYQNKNLIILNNEDNICNEIGLNGRESENQVINICGNIIYNDEVIKSFDIQNNLHDNIEINKLEKEEELNESIIMNENDYEVNCYGVENSNIKEHETKKHTESLLEEKKLQDFQFMCFNAELRKNSGAFIGSKSLDTQVENEKNNVYANIGFEEKAEDNVEVNDLFKDIYIKNEGVVLNNDLNYENVNVEVDKNGDVELISKYEENNLIIGETGVDTILYEKVYLNDDHIKTINNMSRLSINGYTIVKSENDEEEKEVGSVLNYLDKNGEKETIEQPKAENIYNGDKVRSKYFEHEIEEMNSIFYDENALDTCNDEKHNISAIKVTKTEEEQCDINFIVTDDINLCKQNDIDVNMTGDARLRRKSMFTKDNTFIDSFNLTHEELNDIAVDDKIENRDTAKDQIIFDNDISNVNELLIEKEEEIDNKEKSSLVKNLLFELVVDHYESDVIFKDDEDNDELVDSVINTVFSSKRTPVKASNKKEESFLENEELIGKTFYGSEAERIILGKNVSVRKKRKSKGMLMKLKKKK